MFQSDNSFKQFRSRRRAAIDEDDQLSGESIFPATVGEIEDLLSAEGCEGAS